MGKGNPAYARARDAITTPDGRVRRDSAASARFGLRKLELEALLPMLLAFSGFVGVSPLVAIRAINGEYVVAAIDTVVALSFLAVAWAIYRWNAVRAASIYLAFVSTLGVIAVVHAKGGDMVYWAYPTVVGLFFLLRPLEAAVISCLAVAAMVPALAAEQQATLTTVVVFSFVITLGDAAAFAALTQAQRRRLHAMALIDSLTGTANRRAMDESMPQIMEKARSSDLPLSLIMLDIDYFKRINDEYGHAVGDRVLITVAECICANTRSTDRVFRVGGEEFVVIAESAGVALAQRLGEKLREAVAALEFPLPRSGNKLRDVTISLGVAELLPDETADHWYKRADDALYEAKRSGRNRTLLADKTVSLSGTDRYPTRAKARERG